LTNTDAIQPPGVGKRIDKLSISKEPSTVKYFALYLQLFHVVKDCFHIKRPDSASVKAQKTPLDEAEKPLLQYAEEYTWEKASCFYRQEVYNPLTSLH
jgi:hypothetical protein